jgi:phage terminase small subunit
MAKKGELTRKQQLFIAEYLVDLNATQAAIRAGYSVKTAGWIGYENLTKPYIAEAIQKARDEKIASAGITAEWVLKSLQSVANRCMQEEPVLDREGNPTGEYQFAHSGANRALELLGKHVGVFDTGDGPQKILIDLRLPENSGWTKPYHEAPDES